MAFTAKRAEVIDLPNVMPPSMVPCGGPDQSECFSDAADWSLPFLLYGQCDLVSAESGPYVDARRLEEGGSDDTSVDGEPTL
jgi:hypothetical protein